MAITAVFAVLSISGVDVDVDVSTAVSVTEEQFVCVNMDWWPSNKCNWGVCPWGDAGVLSSNLEDPDLIRLLSSFDGVHLRIGGSLADQIVYDTGNFSECTGYTPLPPTNATWFHGGCLHMNRWDTINDFAKKSNATILFGIDANYGRSSSPTKDWDPSNALALMRYTVAKKHTNIFAFEFGNALGYNATVFARGIRQLHDAISTAYNGSGLTMPKIVAPDEKGFPEGFFAELIPLVKDVVHAVSWHNYPLGESYQNPKLEGNVMSPRQHDAWIGVARNASVLARNVSSGAVGVWMGESGGAANSGHNGTSNRFLYAFWYLDSLGGFAAAGHGAFCRQTLIGGNYELIDHRNNAPNPDFFGALLFHRLMGPTVLQATSGDESLRVWAHCTRGGGGGGGGGANVTFLLMNFGNTSLAVDLPAVKGPTRLEYHMTAPFINATQVYLNGALLTAETEEMVPQVVPASAPLTLTNVSYAFVVYPLSKGSGVC